VIEFSIFNPGEFHGLNIILNGKKSNFFIDNRYEIL